MVSVDVKPHVSLLRLKGPGPLSGAIVRHTDSDVTIGQRLVSDRNLACAVLIRNKTLSNAEVEVRVRQFLIVMALISEKSQL